jgi:hypothetical protein
MPTHNLSLHHRSNSGCIIDVTSVLVDLPETLGCLHIHLPGQISVKRLDGKVVSAVLVTMLYIFSKFPWVCGGHRFKSCQKQEKNVIFGVFLELTGAVGAAELTAPPCSEGGQCSGTLLSLAALRSFRAETSFLMSHSH